MANFKRVLQCDLSDDGLALVLQIELSNGSVRACHWPLYDLLTNMEEIRPSTLAGHLREVLDASSERDAFERSGGKPH